MIDHRVRKLGIGGSDVAALFGVDEYKDSFAVWASKKGGVEPEEADDHMAVGKIFEVPTLQVYSRMSGNIIAYCDETYQHPTRPFQIYSPDALVPGQRRGVEAKVVFWGQRDKWGWEPHEMPLRVQMQCHWYMSAMDYPQWDVAALLGEGLPRIYTVDRLDVEAETAMLKRAEEWWLRYIVGDERPPLGASEEAARWLAKTYPTHKRPDMREATPDEAHLLEQYLILRVTQREMKQVRDYLEIQIKDAIRDREGLTWDGNNVTWRKTKDRSEMNWEALATGLLTKFVKDEEQQAALKNLHTNTKDGYRRMHVSHPLLNRVRRGNGVKETEEATV